MKIEKKQWLHLLVTEKHPSCLTHSWRISHCEYNQASAREQNRLVKDFAQVVVCKV